jgi:hypothetical protein
MFDNFLIMDFPFWCYDEIFYWSMFDHFFMTDPFLFFLLNHNFSFLFLLNGCYFLKFILSMLNRLRLMTQMLFFLANSWFLTFYLHFLLYLYFYFDWHFILQMCQYRMILYSCLHSCLLLISLDFMNHQCCLQFCWLLLKRT